VNVAFVACLVVIGLAVAGFAVALSLIVREMLQENGIRNED